jgi:hypothetical protein
LRDLALADLLGRLVELEADVRYQELAAEGVPRIGCALGTTPVLLSAPHGAVHTRRGESKEQEESAAALAQLELHPSLRVVDRRDGATLSRPFRGDSERIGSVIGALVRLVSLLSSGEKSYG